MPTSEPAGTTEPAGIDAAGGWPGVLSRLMRGGDLSGWEAEAVLGEVLSGAATPAQIAAFVTALRVKGETVEEMAGLVRAMLAFAERVTLDGDVVDTCGTGGDGRRTINVSTIAAFVVAGAGARVCKHGGRAASSATGSADVLEALGVEIELGPEGVRSCIEAAGIGFCFAPLYHPAMRFAGPVRRELGVPTIFNVLGPLANPARATRQVVGVADPAMAEKVAGVLVANGTKRAIVAYGEDGLDELSTTAPSRLLDVTVGPDGAVQVSPARVEATELGLRAATLEALAGGQPSENAAAARRVLEGARGPHRDIVVLNAAAGLVVAGLAADLASGVCLAGEVIDDGRASTSLSRLVDASREAAARHSGGAR